MTRKLLFDVEQFNYNDYEGMLEVLDDIYSDIHKLSNWFNASVKYLDFAHKNVKYEDEKLHFFDIEDFLQRFDFKEGQRIYKDGDNYIFIILGQWYTYTVDNSWHQVTTQVTLTPVNN